MQHRFKVVTLSPTRSKVWDRMLSKYLNINFYSRGTAKRYARQLNKPQENIPKFKSFLKTQKEINKAEKPERKNRLWTKIFKVFKLNQSTSINSEE